jgi:bifunctional non-homologous end joining protein LigD
MKTAPAIPKRARLSSLTPESLVPMYASVGIEVPTGRDWTFEPKYDGVRVLAHVNARAVRLMTRNLKDKSVQFPEVVEALRARFATSRSPFILDGEIVAIDKKDPARFQQLQSRLHVKDAGEIERHVRDAPAALIAFDILRDGEHVLLREPWSTRREHLEARLHGTLPPALRLGDTRRGGGRVVLARARRNGWEGIIAKRTESIYTPGVRSPEWLKLKVEFRQEFVVGGWTEPRNSRPYIGALLLGYYDGDELVYVGHTGGGFTNDELAQMHARLVRLERRSSPFRMPPRTNEPAHWVTPSIVVEVKFNEWTKDGKLRQPIYVGTRDDKSAREVTREGKSVQ